MTIRKKFLISALLVMVALGAIGSFTGITVRDRQQRQVRQSVALVADLEKQRVLSSLQATNQALSLAAQTENLGPRLDEFAADPSPAKRAALEAFVADVVSLLPGVRAVTVAGADGKPILDSSVVGEAFRPLITTESDIALGVSAVRDGATERVLRAAQVAAGDSRFLHVMPVAGAGGPRGFMIAECDFGPMQEVVNGSRVLGTSAETTFVERTDAGALILNRLAFRDDPPFTVTIPLTKATAPAVLAIDGPQTTHTDAVDYRGKKVITAIRRIPNTPWGLAIKVDQDEAYAGVERVLRLGVIGFAVSGGVALAAFVMSFTSISRRIRRVSESARALSDGDLTARVSDDAGDELGQMARSFNRMADTLVADMAHRRRAEADLAHSARHDPLTGLPNRKAFEDELTRALAQQSAPGQVAVLFCDLDDFKVVNDDLGHSAGDMLLREVTVRLRRATGRDHVLARFGGDEFVVVARGLGDPAEAVQLGDRMVEALSSAGITLAGREIFVTTSVGVAVSAPGSTSETLVRDADAAMYQAKKIGRNRVVAHNASIQARANNRVAMGSELQRAISQQGLTMALQMIVDLETGAPYAFEALVRWVHEGREIDPSEFVLRATELDLAGALDRWVLDEACRTMMRVDPSHLAASGWLHVNVTGTSLVDDDFAEDALRILLRHGIPPSALCLEIVEDRLGGAPTLALRNLARLRREGVRVAIDDFGTGHSSLARLRDLPADIVKIDQSFVREIDGDPTALAITTSIVSLARRLGLEVIAEGVETAAQRSALLELGCRYGQGYLMGFPFPATEIDERVGHGAGRV